MKGIDHSIDVIFDFNEFIAHKYFFVKNKIKFLSVIKKLKD